MSEVLSDKLREQYHDLQNAIDALERGEIGAVDVKKKSSLLGIYRERTGKYMLRVRRTAGLATPQNLIDAAAIMSEFEIDHVHFSTRQNMQFHGVSAPVVEKVILAFCNAGMIFRGGGGNTFRNVATSPCSGVSSSEIFDTIPHTETMWNWVFNYEKAYQFGRKFKLGFTSEPKDDSNAGIQDMGFLPVIKDGERGFKVYGGGGMGRGASLCTTLFDFLPEKDILRAAQAMIDLFYDHGDREKRNRARLRFVCQDLGEDGFKKLFMDYYSKADAPDATMNPINYNAMLDELKRFDNAFDDSQEYKDWVKRSVRDTKFADDIKTVRLYIRRGNFNSEQLNQLGEILKEVSVPGIRLSIEQDAFIPLIHSSALPTLYKLLREKLPVQATTDGSYDRHIVSCIGAAECPIGVLKSPEAATAIAENLDTLIKEYSDIAADVYEGIIDGINISGCASSCGINQVSGLGFHGGKKRVNGEMVEFYQIHVGGSINEFRAHALAKTDENWMVRADSISEFVSTVVRAYLDSYRGGNKLSFRDFMIELRESFEPSNFGVEPLE